MAQRGGGRVPAWPFLIRQTLLYRWRRRRCLNDAQVDASPRRSRESCACATTVFLQDSARPARVSFAFATLCLCVCVVKQKMTIDDALRQFLGSAHNLARESLHATIGAIDNTIKFFGIGKVTLALWEVILALEGVVLAVLKVALAILDLDAFWQMATYFVCAVFAAGLIATLFGVEPPRPPPPLPPKRRRYAK